MDDLYLTTCTSKVAKELLMQKVKGNEQETLFSAQYADSI